MVIQKNYLLIVFLLFVILNINKGLLQENFENKLKLCQNLVIGTHLVLIKR